MSDIPQEARPYAYEPAELTPLSVGLGLALSVIMGAANVYLGLRVGMTVSAAIPSAVVAMAILNGVLGRRSILEANQVQTAASAGESLAAGIIFTVPALILVGAWDDFYFWPTTLIALSGGLLGALFMIPMRRVFIVNNRDLQYPEAVACAEVLKTAEADAAGHRSGGVVIIFTWLAIGAVFKLLESFAGLFVATVEYATVRASRIVVGGMDLSPALVGVGLIVGLPVAVQIFAGGALGWFVAIPILSEPPYDGEPFAIAQQIWKSQVRYIGVGAMIVGGVASIWKVRSGMVTAVRELAKQFRSNQSVESVTETDRDLPGGVIIALTVFTIAVIAGIYYWCLESASMTAITTGVMVVMSFFLTAVASYLVGLVGGSNSPVSGMTIMAVLVTGALLTILSKLGLVETSGTAGVTAILVVAGVVCCVACASGDMSNDLKTGWLVGASPRRQQLLEVLAVAAAAPVMAPIMHVLHVSSIQKGTGGIGGEELSAPQARLFADLAKGFFGDGQLPWHMIGIGAAIGAGILFADQILARRNSTFRLHVMAVAVGIYLPVGLSVPILIGGLLHWALARSKTTDGSHGADRGVLVASGVIAGESLIGVLVGFLTYFGVPNPQLSQKFGLSHGAVELVSLAAFAVIVGLMYVAARFRRA